MRRSAGIALAAATTAAGIAAAAHAAYSPSRIVAQLNKERAALGIPKVRESASKSAACRAHDNYMRRNRLLTHDEQRGKPGYSAAGDTAARMSVLAGPHSGWAKRNPWLNAPIHLSQVYSPRLRTTGAADVSGYSCLFTFPLGSASAGAKRAWTYPADGGTIAHAQHANEGPYLAQQKVGIRASRTTGPYLLVWSAGTSSKPLTHLVRGSLKGPDGAVAVKLIDSRVLDHLVQPGAGFLLPVKPLKAGATYTATIELGPSTRHATLTHTWTFRATSATSRG